MSFLRNAWYCAGFSSDLATGHLRPIKVLGEDLVLFRDAEGRAAALADRCPHRFAPLSRGRVIEGVVQCGYHGLRFDGSGQCVHNPHGGGALPRAAVARSYPVLERHAALWVWMGEPGRADPNLLPDFSMTEERPGWSRVRGYLSVRANYQLVADNLLDLSHVSFLHPLLASEGGPPHPEFEARITAEQRGTTVVAINEFRHMVMTPLYRMFWERGEAPAFCEMRANMRWDPPSALYLDTGATAVNASREDGPSLLQGHWLTPETDLTTHYFWCIARDRFVSDAEMGARLAAGIDDAFRNEDEPMIEAVQRNMGGADLWALRPVLLATDNAAVRARRVMDKLIAAEVGGSPDAQ